MHRSKPTEQVFQPWTAISWNESCVKRLMNEPNTQLVRTDQRMFGQKDLESQPIRKRTGFLTNHANIAAALRRTCKGMHTHQPCVGVTHGKSCASQAARYPIALIDAVLEPLQRMDVIPMTCGMCRSAVSTGLNHVLTDPPEM